MALILSIDTATELASIALMSGSEVLGIMRNARQKDHAAWVHGAIEELMQEAEQQLDQLDAIAVTSGPGSYTGLRVGMATAKGLCYVLRIPLITESTLKTMAWAAIEQGDESGEGGLLCPMIDARRMEVFTAVYTSGLSEILPQAPMVLTDQSFHELLPHQTVHFFGSGSTKWKELVKHDNAFFADVEHDASHLGALAKSKFEGADFTDPAYAEPVYLKEFYTHTKK